MNLSLTFQLTVFVWYTWAETLFLVFLNPLCGNLTISETSMYLTTQSQRYLGHQEYLIRNWMCPETLISPCSWNCLDSLFVTFVSKIWKHCKGPIWYEILVVSLWLNIFVASIGLGCQVLGWSRASKYQPQPNTTGEI